MSRIAKQPVEIPEGVEVTLAGQTVTAKGKLGELSVSVRNNVELTKEDNLIWVKPRTRSVNARKMWGTAHRVINNIVTGVNEGFSKKLELSGVGYRAQQRGKGVTLQVGLSHEVVYEAPEGIEIKVPDQNNIEISGADKQLVGQVAAEIRAVRPPEPYKGKGIKYAGEYILRKEGKKK